MIHKRKNLQQVTDARIHSDVTSDLFRQDGKFETNAHYEASRCE